MSRTLCIAGLIVLAALAGCKRKSAFAASKTEVGLVFDAGGLGDKSFNDAANRGLQRAKQELGVAVVVIEPSEQTPHEAALRRLAQKGTPLVLGIGFLFSDKIARMAREFPRLKFVCIDYTVPRDGKLPQNLLGITFREQEGCYLVGAIAALVSKTGKIGFVGGMSSDLIRKFEAGYRAGARAVRPGVQVLVDYVGQTGQAWNDPVKGKELGLAMYQRGADVVMHAAGTSGLGVFRAAQQTGKLAIGVDSDQAEAAPGHILTSMLKRVDEAVFRAIRDFKQGRFKGGVLRLGLAENAVGYVYDEKNRRWITPAIHERVESLRKEIVAGKIEVPSK